MAKSYMSENNCQKASTKLRIIPPLATSFNPFSLLDCIKSIAAETKTTIRIQVNSPACCKNAGKIDRYSVFIASKEMSWSVMVNHQTMSVMHKSNNSVAIKNLACFILSGLKLGAYKIKLRKYCYASIRFSCAHLPEKADRHFSYFCALDLKLGQVSSGVYNTINCTDGQFFVGLSFFVV